MQNSPSKKFFSYSFLFGIFLLAAALPYSKFLMSLAEIILFLSWIFEGGLKEKWRLFIKNKIALAISSLFILHVIGLLYTADFTYGIEDIKKKIPLILLPLLFSTMPPLSKQMFERVLSLFTLSVIIATGICFFVLLGYTNKEILHPQQASIFISHIRFGLLISLSVFILGYFFTEKQSFILKGVTLLLMIWLIIFLIIMESATGLLCTLAGFALLFIRTIFTSTSTKTKFALTALMIMGCFSIIKIYDSLASEFAQAHTQSENLPSMTKAGNPYVNDIANKEIENGNFVWRAVCEVELKETWNNKSEIDYSGKDLRGNDIKYTLIRFLTSKGLTKDKEGVNMLSKEELQAIEKGIPNVNFTGIFNPTARLQKVIWEFDLYLKGGNPSGHSVVQRLEFWKAAVQIIKENPLIGVGTGDVKDAFEMQYEQMNSPLTKEWRLRSHNQFLAIGTAFGITGLLFFLFTLVYPLFKNKKYNSYLYLMFFTIAFLSMFTEDTLESQAGVTFFAFFNSIFLFLRKENKPKNQE